MNVYSVDANGIVMAATKNVERKVAELLKAQEELTITKLLAGIKNMQNAGETIQTTPAITESIPANAIGTRDVRFKKTGWSRATIGRKKMILTEWRRSTLSKLVFDEFEAFVRKLGKTQPEQFEWCLRLSQEAILRLYNYVMDEATK